MLKAYYKLTVFESDNKKIRCSTRKKKAKSFVKAFGQILYGFLYGGISLSVLDINNNDKTLEASYLNVIHPGGDNNSKYPSYRGETQNADEKGIVVGTNNTAVNIIDYSLNTQITHGTGTGQLEHLSCACHNVQENVGAKTASFDIVRIFRNSSGGTISIAEAGVYGVGTYISSYYYTFNLCLIRDVVSPAVDIDDGEYLKVTYTIQVAS